MVFPSLCLFDMILNFRSKPNKEKNFYDYSNNTRNKKKKGESELNLEIVFNNARTLLCGVGVDCFANFTFPISVFLFILSEKTVKIQFLLRLKKRRNIQRRERTEKGEKFEHLFYYEKKYISKNNPVIARGIHAKVKSSVRLFLLLRIFHIDFSYLLYTSSLLFFLFLLIDPALFYVHIQYQTHSYLFIFPVLLK